MEYNLKVWLLDKGMKVKIVDYHPDVRKDLKPILSKVVTVENIVVVGDRMAAIVLIDDILTAIEYSYIDSIVFNPYDLTSNEEVDSITIPKSEYDILKRVFDKFVGDGKQ